MSGTDIGAIMSGIGTLILAYAQLTQRRQTRRRRPQARQKEGEKPQVWERWAVKYPRWVPTFCVLLAFTSIGLIAVPRIVGKLAINLTYPEDGLSIPLEVTVEGYATEELSSEQHLYIVVEYGGLWWPQYSEATIGYSHTTERYEFHMPARIGKEEDVGETFVIRAILVDPSIHHHFQAWFQEHAVMAEWPGIPITEVKQLGEVKIYDSVTVTRQ